MPPCTRLSVCLRRKLTKRMCTYMTWLNHFCGPTRRGSYPSYAEASNGRTSFRSKPCSAATSSMRQGSLFSGCSSFVVSACRVLHSSASHVNLSRFLSPKVPNNPTRSVHGKLKSRRMKAPASLTPRERHLNLTPVLQHTVDAAKETSHELFARITKDHSLPERIRKDPHDAVKTTFLHLGDQPCRIHPVFHLDAGVACNSARFASALRYFAQTSSRLSSDVAVMWALVPRSSGAS